MLLQRIFTLVLLSVFIWISPGSSQAGELNVGIIGDQTGSLDLDASYEALSKGVEILKAREVQLVLHVGDLIESTRSDEECKRDYQKAAGILDGLGVPWYLTPGDHDVNPVAWEAGSDDRSKETLFRGLYAEKVPEFKDRMYYSFDFGGVHFIALYTHETLRVDPRWGNVFLAKISDAQLDWLEQDLERNKACAGVVVFLHQPLWYHWAGWARVHRLLACYPVRAVIAGHFHYDQDEGTLDGIRYVIVGATGGGVKDASRDAGNAWHVTTLRLSGESVKFTLSPLEGEEPLELTPRTQMDRVQAVESMMDGLYGFGSRNPVFLKDRRLCSSCDTDAPAVLTLTRVGNPIDLPLTVTIQPLSSHTALREAAFVVEACASSPSDSSCVLPPGERVVLSNTSFVRLTYDGSDPEPLWSARPVPKDGATIEPGTPLQLQIRAEFQGEDRTYWVDRVVSVAVKGCP